MFAADEDYEWDDCPPCETTCENDSPRTIVLGALAAAAAPIVVNAVVRFVRYAWDVLHAHEREAHEPRKRTPHTPRAKPKRKG